MVVTVKLECVVVVTVKLDCSVCDSSDSEIRLLSVCGGIDSDRLTCVSDGPLARTG